MEAGQLFVYGTLQHPEVMRQVVGRLPHARKAVARECARRRLKDRCYTWMFFSAGETTPGLVYESITNAEWLKLNAYEAEI